MNKKVFKDMDDSWRVNLEQAFVLYDSIAE